MFVGDKQELHLSFFPHLYPCPLLPVSVIPYIFWYKMVYSPVSVIRKEIIRSSWTQAAGSLLNTKRSRVSRIQAITDTDMGEEKRTGEVPTLQIF